MGFASCLEDITTRSHEMTSTRLIGPSAGETKSEDYFSELYIALRQVSKLMLRQGEAGTWDDLARELDRVQTEISRYSVATLRLSFAQSGAYTAQLETRMRAALEKGRMILESIHTDLRVVFNLLDRIDNWQRLHRASQFSTVENRLYEEAVFWINQYRVLEREYENLERRSEELTVYLAGQAMENILIASILEMPEKD
jgi:hypothetical protein